MKREDFRITPITGGMTNLLYKCSLRDEVKLLPGEKRHILLRLYGRIIKDSPETSVIDPVVFGLLAEKGLGPQLYGVFLDGRLEEYIPSRSLTTSELNNSAISQCCARIMASFHTLNLPIRKTPGRLFEETQGFLAATLKSMTAVPYSSDRAERVSKLLAYNLPNEVNFMWSLLANVKSPIVFCHNDLSAGNILYVENNTSDTGTQWRLQPIDFEYSFYNYRGFDIGNHFCEWCYDYNVESAPYFKATLSSYPTEEEQINFIRAYLEPELPTKETIEEVRLEANAFALASHMMWGLWAAAQSAVSTIQFDYLEYALTRLEHYTLQKAEVLNMMQETRKH